MTREQYLLSRKNSKIAAKKLNLQKGYVMHHKDETLKTENIERYIEWRLEDLEVMSKSEHIAYHNSKRVLSDETKEKQSKALKGCSWKVIDGVRTYIPANQLYQK